MFLRRGSSMKLRMLVFLAALVSFSAYAADSAAPSPAPDTMNPVTFCNGRYALCIKAPCKRDVANASEKVNCLCDVINGWSMGPQSCDVRKVKLISTYSNLYNKTNLTLSC